MMDTYTNIAIKEIQGEDCIVDKGFLASIQSEGVLVPLILEESGSGYTVIDGRRRLMAAKTADHETVPARVIVPTADLLGVLLNLQRSSNLAYEVKALRGFIQAGYTQDEIAEILHMTKTRLKQHFRLLAFCDDGLKALGEGRLKTSAALALSRLPEEKQKKILFEYKDGKITLKDVESSWKEFRIDEAILNLPGIENENLEDQADTTGIQVVSDLIRDFEVLVSKMTSSTPIPTEIQDATHVLREYLKIISNGSDLEVLEKIVA